MRTIDDLRFKYCPRCGEPRLRSNESNSIVCQSCNFIYYHGPIAVAVGIVEYDGQIILTQRAHEPRKGLLALPGGFVDYNESLESALIRELREELNLSIISPTYLCSHWERYLFREVVYYASIAFFVVCTDHISNVEAKDDIEAFFLIRPRDIDGSNLAFESDKVALNRYRKLDGERKS